MPISVSLSDGCLTKFGQLGVFSGMNNPWTSPWTNGMPPLWYLTETELHLLFDAEIHHLAEDNGLTD